MFRVILTVLNRDYSIYPLLRPLLRTVSIRGNIPRFGACLLGGQGVLDSFFFGRLWRIWHWGFLKANYSVVEQGMGE